MLRECNGGNGVWFLPVLRNWHLYISFAVGEAQLDCIIFVLLLPLFCVWRESLFISDKMEVS